MLKDFIYAQEGQSIWDIAVQEYGAPEGAKQLIIDNPDVCSFQYNPEPGVKIYIDKTKIINQDNVTLLKVAGSVPANEYTDKWILAKGRWNDTGRWDDNAEWID